MQLFYDPALQPSTEVFSFEKEESRHIAKVLRKKEGDILFVTNGLGSLFTTEIIECRETKCTARIVSVTTETPRHPRLHLAVAPTKMNERYEWFLEKATEIGIEAITPIICDHSERTVVKPERLEKIVVAAMKQSNQTYLPKLHPAMPFSQFISQAREGARFIAHCEDDEKHPLKNALKPGEDAVILIGPEGDFSPKEIQLALANGYLPVSLGNTRLRTETAALVACHTFTVLNE
ncbi:MULTISPECIES: 16S rRNA (uracil(1498)-N(3))-methyltransferase [unclassified Flavobacterium]|uniref:16S rRNA (uracil(1498)-N(3))-methyltransferase n=1 Tax=unclassified Flavobacterium TaxID=196869 RepID=UPI001F137A04|nr:MULTISPECIES: 16S rRNA (uracil(1498)-N(3))-methyltransferase [unclassified Flavobacterium]UMY65069.1 16S rRNA (uracil(1498)-N(3))-methyltransferase [Flavobacterium sp. HJ-32-4]